MALVERVDHDFCIIGGGFYGLCIALYLKGAGARVVVYEAEEEVLSRASRVNQARIHTGFHYPRSFTTAMRSLVLHQRFASDFPDAVIDDFEMLYAIAKRRSKVSTARFANMFTQMGAPFSVAPQHLVNLFEKDLIDSVFRTKEWAFDYRAIAKQLLKLLDRTSGELQLGSRVAHIEQLDDSVRVVLVDGRSTSCKIAFNCAYAHLNDVLHSSNISPLPLKHELVEIALVTPPEELAGLAITVMDGPFFSTMPYPSTQSYSLTHVRYTPHFSWEDGIQRVENPLNKFLPKPRWRHMKQDAQRYMPCLARVEWQKSLFETKTVATKNEQDDGRPILLHRHHDAPNLLSVLGGKIDNIYDLFSALPLVDARIGKVDTATIFTQDRF